MLGTHPVSNVSYVSTIGTNSRLVAYGNNRADFTFIPGGIIPGMIIVEPDFPELKPSLPFLWFENEYVVDAVASYILAADAANALAKQAQARGVASLPLQYKQTVRLPTGN